MGRMGKIMSILHVLAKNVEINKQPGLVDSNDIASELDYSLSETKKLLNIMNSMGICQSNSETEYSLITIDGLKNVKACGVSLLQN